MASNKLFNKNFSLVLVAQIISLFGNAIIRFALPLHLLRSTGSSTLFGLVSATAFLPMIVLSLFGGVLADRVNKRNIMIVLDLMTALVIIVFYFALGQLPIVPLFIVTLMFGYGIAGVYQPALQSSVPFLVSADKIGSANSLLTMITTVSGLLAPAIGGIIYGEWGIVPILIISILCVVFSAIMKIFVTIPNITQNKAFSIIQHDLKEAFVFIKTEKPLFFTVTAIICAVNMIYSSALVIGMPIIIIEILELSDSMLGFNQSLLALGGLVGALMTAMLSQKIKTENLYAALVFSALLAATMGITLLFNPSTIATYYILSAMCFLSALSATTFSIQLITIVQRQTPPQLLGKVMASIMTLSMCAMPIGQAIYGWLFDIFSNTAGIILLAVALIMLALGMYSKGVFKKITE